MLSNLFHRSSKVYRNKPFIRNPNESIITYKDAYALSCRHQEWIEDKVLNHEIFRRQQKKYVSEEIDLATSNKNVESHVEVVIAYLSSNSPDLLLSIFGAIALRRKAMTIVEKNGIQIQVRIRIALLNFRWSSREIATALSVRGSGGHTDHLPCRHETILLCDKDLSSVAREACLFINNSALVREHTCMAVQLPSLTMSNLDELPSNDSQALENMSSAEVSYDDDEAIILFTSGTTTGPKGVKLSHMALFIQAMAKLHNPCCYDSNTIMFATTVPFFHVGGINSAISLMIAGGCLYFPKQKGYSFDPKLVVKSIFIGEGSQNTNQYHYSTSRGKDISANTLVIVPAMLHSILHEIEADNNEEERKKDGSSSKIYDNVRLLLIGGQNITERQLHLSKIYFPNARIVQTFACTEAASSLTFNNLFDPTKNDLKTFPRLKESIHDIDFKSKEIDLGDYHGIYVGLPPPHVELCIFELDDAIQRAPSYKVGTIGTRGPHIMKGYWKRGQDEDGLGVTSQWLVTNDLGYIDDNGGLHFCGRLNDVIRTGGESVFAAEVEAVLLRHPNIDQCAVFALPDERMGECVSAAIVLKQSSMKLFSDIDENIREFCYSQLLSSYKRPRKIYILDELPRNSSGKVLKNELVRRLTMRSKL